MKNKIFIVNLSKDVTKKQYMQQLCSQKKMDVEFIEAFYGKELDIKFIKENYSKELSIKTIGRELSKGEIGCALSHKFIYKKIINENINYALVLEDDIDCFIGKDELKNIIDSLENNWELVLLGHHTNFSRHKETAMSFWNRRKILDNYLIGYPVEKAYGTYGYLVSKNGAKKLLKHLQIIQKPIDHYTGDNKLLNLYIINPTPIVINDILSDEHHSMQDRVLLKNNFSHFSLKKRLMAILQKIKLLQYILNLKYFILQFKKIRYRA